jgi:hypothetical protein
MVLNKWERNKIYERIAGGGLDPAEFDFDDTGEKVRITHGSGSTFEFSRKEKLSNPLLEEFQIDFDDRYEYEV